MIFDFFRILGIITGYPAQLIFFKTKVYYENKAKQSRRIKGGALVISNHFNLVDFIVNTFVVFPRKLYVVASEHAYRNRGFSFGMRFFGGVKADRTTKSMRFIDDSIELIKNGKLVQIFPEGHNTPDGSIKPFKPTYLMIALKSDRPIIPIITNGSYGLFKRTRVIIGEPIYLSQLTNTENVTKEELARLNEIIYNKALALKETLDGYTKGK